MTDIRQCGCLQPGKMRVSPLTPADSEIRETKSPKDEAIMTIPSSPSHPLFIAETTNRRSTPAAHEAWQTQAMQKAAEIAERTRGFD